MDVDECRDTPCHRTGLCRNALGSYSCVCPEGQVGDPVVTGCRNPGDCLDDSECPDAAACFQAKCRNPCEIPGACGVGAQCQTVNHKAVCSCPPRTTGDPLTSCVALECLGHNECPADKSCVNNKCVNPCSIPGVCGKNSECVARSHLHQCFCKPGFTGDATLGCTDITYCQVETDCPSGEQCNGGVCLRKFLVFLLISVHEKIDKP